MRLVGAVRLWLRRTGVLAYWICRPRLPWAVAEVLVRRRVRRAQRSPRAMAYAREQMQILLAATPQAPLIEEKAAEFLAFDITASERRWNRRRLFDQRIVGLEHLTHARALGRGVVLSFAHQGNFAGTFGAIADAGVPHGVVAADSIMSPYASPNMRQHLRNVARGGELVPASEGTRGLIARLNDGQVLAIASDVPGGTTVPFAGRSAAVSSGAAWAATSANSPVVLMTQDRDDDGPFVQIHEPIEPADFTGAPELLHRIVAHHEAAVLRWPEAAYHPMVCWPIATEGETVEPEVPEEPSGLDGTAVRRRMRLILADQLLSGGSNVLVAMVAAHVLPTASFGLYGIVSMTYILAAGVIRALVNDPVLVHPEQALSRRAEVVGANLALGLIVGALVALGGAFARLASVPLGDALMILGACLPLLGLQDLGRYLGIVSQRPGRAIILDGLWLVLLAGFLPFVILGHAQTLPVFILAWAGAGALAGLLVPLYYRNPLLRSGVQWLTYTWWFSWRYLASYLTTQTAGLGALVGVGAIAGAAPLGGVQGSILLTRPYGLFQAALNASAVSEVARSAAGAAEVRAHALRTSRLATLVAIVNTAIMLALPTFLGRVVLGETWTAARPLLWATGVQIVFLGMSTGFRATLLGRKQAHYTVMVDIVATICTMVAVFIGVWWNGALGAVWGATIVQGLAVLVWWRLLAWRASVGALEPVSTVEPVIA